MGGIEQIVQRTEASYAQDAMDAALATQKNEAQGKEKKKSANCLALEKIKVSAKIATAIELVVAEAKAVKTLFDETVAKMDTLLNQTQPDDSQASTQSQTDHFAELKQEFMESRDNANSQLDQLKGSLVGRQTRVNDTDSIDTVLNEFKSANEEAKGTKKGAVKEFHGYAGKVAAALRTSNRDTGRQKQARREQQSERDRVKPAMWNCLMHFPEKVKNVANSIFETKGGLRPSLSAARSDDTLMAVEAHPLVKKAVRAHTIALKGGQDSVVTDIVGGPLSLKKFGEKVQAACDRELFSVGPLPRAEWKGKVYGYQVLSYSDSYSFVGWTHMGMMEARLTLTGSCTIAGVASDVVPGGQFREKRQNISSMPHQTFVDLILSQGWVVTFTDGQTQGGENILAIPSGHMIFMATDKGCKMLRWSFAGDDRDLMRTKASLQNLLDQFPELKASGNGYADYGQYLGLRV